MSNPAYSFGPYQIEHDEMLEFGLKWDPRATHIDGQAARAAGNPGITASTHYLLCVKAALMRELPWFQQLISTEKLGDYRFLKPVHAGAALTLRIEAVNETNTAKGRPEKRVQLALELVDQLGETVLIGHESLVIALPGSAQASAPAAVEGSIKVPQDKSLALATVLAAMKEKGVDVSVRVAHVERTLSADNALASVVQMDFDKGYAAGVGAALGMVRPSEYQAADPAFYAIASQLGAQSMRTMFETEQQQKARDRRRANIIVGCIVLGVVALVLGLVL